MGVWKNHRNICCIILKIKVPIKQECKSHIQPIQQPAASLMSTDLHQLHLWLNKTNHLNNDLMEEKVICFPSLQVSRKHYKNDPKVAKRTNKLAMRSISFSSYILNLQIVFSDINKGTISTKNNSVEVPNKAVCTRTKINHGIGTFTAKSKVRLGFLILPF